VPLHHQPSAVRVVLKLKAPWHKGTTHWVIKTISGGTFTAQRN
jgi:hypothetical protein